MASKLDCWGQQGAYIGFEPAMVVGDLRHEGVVRRGEEEAAELWKQDGPVHSEVLFTADEAPRHDDCHHDGRAQVRPDVACTPAKYSVLVWG